MSFWEIVRYMYTTFISVNNIRKFLGIRFGSDLSKNSKIRTYKIPILSYVRTLSIAAIDGLGFLVTNTCLIIGHASEMTSTKGVQNASSLKITLVYSSKLFKK